MSESTTEIFSFSGGNVMYAAGSGILMTPTKDIARPKATVAEETTADKWAPWGDDNLFPQRVINDVAKSTVIGPAIDKQVRFTYAAGIECGKSKIIDNKEVFVPEIYQPFREFHRKSNLNRYVLEALTDLYWFFNCMPGIILSRDREKIVQLYAEPMEECRLEWQNKNTGMIEHCYMNADWEGVTDEKQMQKIPVIDPYWDPAGNLREKNGFRYVFPVSYPTPGKKFYQLAYWNAARESGWLGFSFMIPEFKTAIMNHQMTLSYHLEVNEEYWPSVFGEWGKWNNTEKAAAKQKWLDNFNKKFIGTKNAAKTIMSPIIRDKSQSLVSAWVITPIDDKMKSGILIEDSHEASTHLLNSLGVDPTIFGNGPGKNFGSGSGSDKNAAYNLFMASVKPFQDLILEPLYLVKEYNGWDDELEFRLKPTFMSRNTSGKPTLETA